MTNSQMTMGLQNVTAQMRDYCARYIGTRDWPEEFLTRAFAASEETEILHPIPASQWAKWLLERTAPVRLAIRECGEIDPGLFLIAVRDAN
jgi:hypothetical protein